MLTKDFLPAVNAYAGEVALNASSKKAFMPSLSTETEEALVTTLTDTYKAITDGVAELKKLTSAADSLDSMQAMADSYHKDVLAKMEDLRLIANDAEALIPDSKLPYPTYDQLLFYV